MRTHDFTHLTLCHQVPGITTRDHLKSFPVVPYSTMPGVTLAYLSVNTTICALDGHLWKCRTRIHWWTVQYWCAGQVLMSWGEPCLVWSVLGYWKILPNVYVCVPSPAHWFQHQATVTFGWYTYRLRLLDWPHQMPSSADNAVQWSIHCVWCLDVPAPCKLNHLFTDLWIMQWFICKSVLTHIRFLQSSQNAILLTF